MNDSDSCEMYPELNCGVAFPLPPLQLSSSFGSLDPFGTGQPLPPLQLPQQTTPQSTVMPLKKPPKWIRRPVGASFSVSASCFCTLQGSRLLTLRNRHLQNARQECVRRSSSIALQTYPRLRMLSGPPTRRRILLGGGWVGGTSHFLSEASLCPAPAVDEYCATSSILALARTRCFFFTELEESRVHGLILGEVSGQLRALSQHFSSGSLSLAGKWNVASTFCFKQ